jgi:hypothetical protein
MYPMCNLFATHCKMLVCHCENLWALLSTSQQEDLPLSAMCHYAFAVFGGYVLSRHDSKPLTISAFTTDRTIPMLITRSKTTHQHSDNGASILSWGRCIVFAGSRPPLKPTQRPVNGYRGQKCFRYVNAADVWNWYFFSVFVVIKLRHTEFAYKSGSFIHLVVCLTTDPKPFPKQTLHIVRSRASSFRHEDPLLS